MFWYEVDKCIQLPAQVLKKKVVLDVAFRNPDTRLHYDHDTFV
jgi:hypothetical protein